MGTKRQWPGLSVARDKLPAVSLHLHRAERTDVLADGLAGLLATPLADPFAEEVVVVPAKGVERWLSQRLSHRLGAAPGAGDGVCAGVRFTSPRSLVAAVLGLTDDDPWAADAMAWPLLAVLDDSLDEAWCAPVARHLGHFDTGAEAELRQGRRYAVSARLARLFAAYAVQRPTLLADWLDGRATDGRGGDLDDDLAWQPELWRRLVDRVGAPPPHQRHADTLTRLRDEPEAFDLPERLSLFGHTRLPVTEVELLDALAARRAVHLWLPHPSGALWDALAPTVGGGAVDRADDDSHHAAAHPLLATLARDSRELQRALAAVPADDEHTPMPAAPDTLLGWLQDDLRGNTLAPAGRRRAAGDRSVQVHACHGAARQVDVLREVLLGMLEADPTLEPRDILVMCPDIETYAPLITAGFGLGDLVEGGHPAHRLRVRLADRSLAQTNPLLGVAAQLLDIAGSRATSSQVLDLAQAEPVRRRFGFTDDDLDTITTWVRESGVRWAFDREHRDAFGLAGYQQNTWRAGLDRVLSGVVMSADAQAWLDTTLPLDDVGSTRIELAGRFAEYVDRVRSVTDRLDGSRPLADWLGALGDGIDVLTRVGRDDGWQVGQVQRELAGVAADADTLADTALRLPDVRALLASHLAGRPTRANFRTGTLTVCTMVPMRSVPHRVVCLLGLDDGVFPRFGLADGDDVLARRPVTGERDVRSEDRQLLCDAILAATESLVVTYTGANEHTGQRRPPAVPLGELLDALDRTTDAPVRAAIEVVHPLQPFDSMNLEPGRLGTAGPFTFDPTALVAARAAAGLRPAAAAVPRRPAGAAGGGGRRPGRPAGVLPRPGEGLLPVPRRDAAVGRRRHLRRDAGRDRQPREVVGRRPDAPRHALRHPPRRGAADGVAPRRPPAGPARLAHRQRDPRAGHAAGDPGPHPPPGRARRRSTSTSTSVAAAGSPARSRASTPGGWSRSATPGSTPSSCWPPGSSCSRSPPTTTTTTGRRSSSAGRRAAATRRPGCSRRSAPTPVRCSPTWSTSTTSAGRSRCRCRSRRPSRGRRPGRPATTRSRPRSRSGSRSAGTARTPTPPTSGCGVRTRASRR